MTTLRSQWPLIVLGWSYSLEHLADMARDAGHHIAGVYDPDGIVNSINAPDLTLDDVLRHRLRHEFIVGTTWVPGAHAVSVRTRHKRQTLIDLIRQHRLTAARIIHPSAVIHASAQIGRNVIIGRGVQINHGVSIGDDVIIKDQAYISHDVQVGRGCLIQIRACVTGGCELGEDCFVGVNSTLVNRHQDGRPQQIGAGSVIAPGVTVITDLEPNTLAWPGSRPRVY